MRDEPGQSAAWDCIIEACTVDQRQAFDPIRRQESKPERDTTAHGYTGEASTWQAEVVKEWSQECRAFGKAPICRHGIALTEAWQVQRENTARIGQSNH